MARIQQVKLANIRENPHRQLGSYPYVEKKLDALKRSFQDVGVWEGIIARKVGSHFEIAFGHHRVEAARRLELDKVPLIVRDLDDEQMLQFMGRENLEEYNADFLTMLESWEAATAFLGVHGLQEGQPTEIARVLGWTHDAGGRDKMNATARACSNATKLIEAGHVEREALADMSVREVRDICEHTAASLEKIDASKHDTASKTRSKKKYVAGMKEVIRQKKEGAKISGQRTRAAIDAQVWSSADIGKELPAVEIAIERMVKSMDRFLDPTKAGGEFENTTTAKLAEIIKFAGEIDKLETGDLQLNHLHAALRDARDRADAWKGKLQKARTTPRKSATAPHLKLIA